MTESDQCTLWSLLAFGGIGLFSLILAAVYAKSLERRDRKAAEKKAREKAEAAKESDDAR